MKSGTVIVIGAGPGGSLTALLLARAGIPVLLLDKMKFPRYKVCGACLSAAAVSELAKAGLSSLLEDAVPLHHFLWMQDKHRAELPLRGAFSLSRESLDAALVNEAVKHGAQFWDNAAVSVDCEESAQPRVRVRALGGETELRPSLVIAAAGIQALSFRGESFQDYEIEKNSRIGAGAVLDSGPGFYEPGVIYMASGKHGYCGLVRQEDGTLNVAAAANPDTLAASKSLPALLAGILEQAGAEIPQGFWRAEWRGTPPLTRRRRWFARNRCFFLGDAAAYVEPFTGEGIAWALTQARLFTELYAIHGSRWRQALENDWQQCVQRFIRERMFLCRSVKSVIRSPFWSLQMNSLLGRFPGLASPVLGRLQGVAP